MSSTRLLMIHIETEQYKHNCITQLQSAKESKRPCERNGKQKLKAI